MSRVWEYIERDKKLRLVIEEDSNVGYYLIIYPIDSNKSLKDYLCDTFDEAVSEAKESYCISETSWKLIKEV